MSGCVDTMADYSVALRDIMNDLVVDMALLDPDSEEYKDRQYLESLIDLCYGATDLCGKGYKYRSRDLEATKKIINNLTVME